MLPAIFDQTTIDIFAGDYTFRATGSVQNSTAYLRVYQMPASDRRSRDDERTMKAKARASSGCGGANSRLDKIRPDQPFHGAAAAVQRCHTGERTRRRRHRRLRHMLRSFRRSSSANTSPRTRAVFRPLMLGERVSTLLIKSFEDIFDVTFTARLEEELDEIEEGKLPWREAVKEFWIRHRPERLTTRCFPYKAGFTGKKCESAVRANCSNASAATVFPRLLALSRM